MWTAFTHWNKKEIKQDEADAQKLYLNLLTKITLLFYNNKQLQPPMDTYNLSNAFH